MAASSTALRKSYNNLRSTSAVWKSQTPADLRSEPFPASSITVSLVEDVTEGALKRFEVQQTKDSAQDAYIEGEFARFDQGLEVKVFTKAGEHLSTAIPGAYSWSMPGSGALPGISHLGAKLHADAGETVVEVENLSAGQSEEVYNDCVYVYTPIVNSPPQSPVPLSWLPPRTHPTPQRNGPFIPLFVTASFGPFYSDDMIPPISLDDKLESRANDVASLRVLESQRQ